MNDIGGVKEVRAGLDGLHVLAEDAATALAGIVEAASTCGVKIASLEASEPDLEHVFLHLTGRELRDQ